MPSGCWTPDPYGNTPNASWLPVDLVGWSPSEEGSAPWPDTGGLRWDVEVKTVTDPPPAGRTLAEKLDHLFRTVHPRGRGPYGYAEVAKALEERGGPTVSATYIWQLRTGARANPTKRHLEALADFFGVSPAYFFDDAEAARIDARLLLLATLRDSGARQIAARLPGLSDTSIEVLADMVTHLRQLEGLTDQPPEQAPAEDDAPAQPAEPPQEQPGAAPAAPDDAEPRSPS